MHAERAWDDARAFNITRHYLRIDTWDDAVMAVVGGDRTRVIASDQRDTAMEERMSPDEIQRPDAPEGRSDASASGPGTTPKTNAAVSPELHAQIAARAYELAKRRDFASGGELQDWLQAEREIEAGPPRNTPPDNPFDGVKTRSNE